MRLMISLLMLVLMVGCQGLSKAVDSTAAVRAITAGEGHVTYSILLGEMLDDPKYAGKLIAIPTVPGKDVDFKLYNDDGSVKASLVTRRSDVIDMLLGSIAGIDVEKFAEDARARAWVSSERDAWMGAIMPLIQARLTQPAETGGGDGGFSAKLNQLANSLGYPNSAAMIEALRRPTPLPTPTPPPNP